MLADDKPGLILSARGAGKRLPLPLARNTQRKNPYEILPLAAGRKRHRACERVIDSVSAAVRVSPGVPGCN